jgi:2-C-methyl-D-erythritol 4-phosphate cytidylyltransferase
VQTPQGFRRDVLTRAYAQATDVVTDDAALVEALGVSVMTVDGDADGFKVTTPFDVTVAEAVLARRVTHVRA